MQNKDNISSLNPLDNETLSIINSQHSSFVYYEKNNIKDIKDEYYFYAININSTENNLVPIVNELLKNEKFYLFQKIFLAKKEKFLLCFFNFLNQIKFNTNADISKLNNEFSFLLHVCCNLNLFKFVEFILIESKKYLNDLILETIYKDDNLNSEFNKEKIFKTFLNKIDNLGYSPIHYAIISGNIKLVNLLLENKADISIRTKNGFSCLHLAASINKLEIFIYLFEKYSKILELEDRDFQENTILHIVCFHGCFDVFNFLIYKNINIYAVDVKGNTALHYAVHNGKFLTFYFYFEFLIFIINLIFFLSFKKIIT